VTRDLGTGPWASREFVDGIRPARAIVWVPFRLLDVVSADTMTHDALLASGWLGVASFWPRHPARIQPEPQGPVAHTPTNKQRVPPG